jgi:hypothetical protein
VDTGFGGLDFDAVAAARLRRRPGSPAELARQLDPKFRVTPTIRLLSDIAVRSIRGADQRDIVSTPPRTGKSQLLSIWTPVWALMVNPDMQIVVVSYADDLAQEHSRKARSIIQEHHEFLGYRLARDKTAVGRWTVEGRRGGMLATGINSGVTGMGADCVSGQTRITTEYGVVTAERAFAEQHSWIWSFDHAAGMAGWHRVEARRRIDGRDVVAVRTEGGGVLRCTPDHRVYTRRGYVPAGQLVRSDQILSHDCVGGVPAVCRGVPGVCDGDPQVGPQRPGWDVLLAGVPCSSIGGGAERAEPRPVRGVPELQGSVPDGARGSAVLLGRVRVRRPQGAADEPSGASARGVRDVRDGVSPEFVAPGVLLAELRRHRALNEDDRPGKFALQDWDELRKLVSVDASVGVGAGRECVRGVRGVPATVDVCESREDGDEVEAGDSSHQRTPGGQSRGESDHVVCDVPCGASQVGYVAVSSVERDGGGPVSVYDFQVEGARNFFADGLLVHNCLLIDDPVKDAAEANSRAHRERVLNEYRATLSTRVHPGGSVCVTMTRWHERDLAGALLDSEPDRWLHTNIPAVADGVVPDALGRAPGVAMTSALGFTAEHFAAQRRTSGERVWWALYQGVPTAPEGGLVKREWLDTWRLPVAPAGTTRTVIGVDPSDSGKGDACGVTAWTLTTDGVAVMLADASAPMTSDQWARAAVDLAVACGASEIAVEGFAARETYVRVVREAIKRANIGRPVAVSSWPPRGSGRGGGDAIARSAALLQGLEVGTARLAGHFPVWEEAAVSWQTGQHQPDGLAASVVAHDVLVHGAGMSMSFSGAPRLGVVAGPGWASRRVG